MGHHRILVIGTRIDGRAVLFGCDGHDVGTWGLFTADLPPGLEAAVASILARAPVQCSALLESDAIDVSIVDHRLVRDCRAGRGRVSGVRCHRRETALWLRDHRPTCIASLLCAAEHATGPWPATCCEYAVSH